MNSRNQLSFLLCFSNFDTGNLTKSITLAECFHDLWRAQTPSGKGYCESIIFRGYYILCFSPWTLFHWNLISQILCLLLCYNALPKCSVVFNFAEIVHTRTLRNKSQAKFKTFTVSHLLLQILFYKSIIHYIWVHYDEIYWNGANWKCTTDLGGGRSQHTCSWVSMHGYPCILSSCSLSDKDRSSPVPPAGVATLSARTSSLFFFFSSSSGADALPDREGLHHNIKLIGSLDTRVYCTIPSNTNTRLITSIWLTHSINTLNHFNHQKGERNIINVTVT